MKAKRWNPFSDYDYLGFYNYIDKCILLQGDRMSYKVFLPMLIRKKLREPVINELLTHINPKNIEIHHVKPMSSGGKTKYENLVPLHREVHRLLTYPSYEPFKNNPSLRKKINFSKISKLKSQD